MFQLENILVKVVVNGIAAIPLLLWFTGDNFLEVAVVTMVLTIMAFAVGDLLILRNSNNTVASIADFGLSYLYIWSASMLMKWPLSLAELFWVSLAITASEVWYHNHLYRKAKAVR